MAIRVNVSRRNPSTGRLERTGEQRVVGRAISSGGGFTTQNVGVVDTRTGEVRITNPTAVSNERGALIEAAQTQAALEKLEQRRQEEAAMVVRTQQAPAPTPTPAPQAVASTVGPGGVPSVIRQSYVPVGSGIVGGGQGTLFEARQDVVPIAGARPTASSATPPSVRQGTVTPSQQARPTIIGAFGSGLRENFTSNLFSGEFGGGGRSEQTSFTFATATPSTLSRGAGELGRAAVESGSILLGGYGYARGSGFVTRSLTSNRLQQTAIGAGLGIGTALSAGAVGRNIETRNIRNDPIFNYPGVDVRGAIDAGSSRYSDQSGFLRSTGESISFGLFADRPRFQQTVAGELITRGVPADRALEIGSAASRTRARTRAIPDVVSAIGAESAGEFTGRGVIFSLDRAASRSGRLSTPIGFAFRRGFGSAAGGVVEGGTSGASASLQGTGRVDTRTVLFGAGAGGLVAGLGGGSIAALQARGTRASARTARVVETGLDILDPWERPGDIAADVFERGAQRRGSVRFTSTRTVRTPGGQSFVVSREDSSPGVVRGPGVVNPSTFGGGFTPSGSFTVAPSSTRSSSSASRTRSGGFTQSFNNLFSGGRNAGSRSVAPSQAFSMTPTTSRTMSQSFVPALTPARSTARTSSRTLVPTNAFNFVPSRNNTRNSALVPSFVPTRTAARTSARTSARVPTPNVPFFPFPPIGGGGGGAGRGGSSGRRRSDVYAPSFTALAFNIRGRRGAREASGFTGLEVRGL